jgi:uncharacterized protein (TIGR02452 family)
MESLATVEFIDSEDLAESWRSQLDITRDLAIYRTRVIKDAVEQGIYEDAAGNQVDWRSDIVEAGVAKRSTPPWHELSPVNPGMSQPTRVRVSNETTLVAAIKLVDQGLKPLVLNFANGVVPGGGFLSGSRAQEETLCRSSSLYWTLVGDPMYLHHSYRDEPDSTDWAIVSPRVPFIFSDTQQPLPQRRHLDVITSAAPYAYTVGQPRSRSLLQSRIHRVLHIANALGYESLVLGAWGCGAFGNDPATTAADFKSALTGEFRHCFSDVVFAITDWSPQRRFLGPFRDAFSAG